MNRVILSSNDPNPDPPKGTHPKNASSIDAVSNVNWKLFLLIVHFKLIIFVTDTTIL